MKVTVLVEDSRGACPDVEPEFGLSLLLEGAFGTVLLDTGSSDRFARNADALGVDLAAVDWLVLTHGHSDHGGGLATFLRRNPRAPVVLRRGAERPHYGTLAPGLPGWLHRARLLTREIGLDPQVLDDAGPRLRWIDADTALVPGLRLLAVTAQPHPAPAGNRFLLQQREGRFLLDDFRHELALVVYERDEAVLFSGCAHLGVLNLLEATRRDLPGVPVRAVIGGFHLVLPRSRRMAHPRSEVVALARTLREAVTGPIYTGHCTGAEAFEVMAGELGSRLRALTTGARFEV
jgi:7,8-dihydropterin-6-yl-methyl-4-(beta-D-ribofuranosyl)aminobenzene 5'-phosphate synthase